MKNPSRPSPARANACTSHPLLAILKAIVTECMDYPPVPRYSHDSYLPAHLLAAAVNGVTGLSLYEDEEGFNLTLYNDCATGSHYITDDFGQRQCYDTILARNVIDPRTPLPSSEGGAQ